jgi:hypothetical protein
MLSWNRGRHLKTPLHFTIHCGDRKMRWVFGEARVRTLSCRSSPSPPLSVLTKEIEEDIF